jgi:hypothetical protein
VLLYCLLYVLSDKTCTIIIVVLLLFLCISKCLTMINRILRFIYSEKSLIFLFFCNAALLPLSVSFDHVYNDPLFGGRPAGRVRVGGDQSTRMFNFMSY